jgi:hypothetical protein
MALVVIITVLPTAWRVKHYIYTSPFTPTILTVKEQKVLVPKWLSCGRQHRKLPSFQRKRNRTRELPLNRKHILKRVRNERPVIALKGVTLGGIPLPNAWLGNLKNRNLVKEFGGEAGFWKVFSEGVADLRVQDGHVVIKLKE